MKWEVVCSIHEVNIHSEAEAQIDSNAGGVLLMKFFHLRCRIPLLP